MKKLTIFLSCMFMAAGLFSQDIQKVARAKTETLSNLPADTAKKRWLLQGTGSLQFTQAAFSNWASGGQNSMGLVTMLNFKASYKKGRHAWANTIDLGYGFNMLGKGNNMEFNKTNDKMELTSAYGLQLHESGKWFFTALVNFRSQFDKGYNYPDDSTVISKFLAPGYLVAGIGFTYSQLKGFYLYMSPSSGRFTFVTDKKLSDAGAFGVDPGKTMRGEFGPYIRADLNHDLATNINLSTTLELYTDYLHKFGNIDVNWSLLLSLKVNKWLATSIQTQLIYDDDVLIQPDPTEHARPMTQFKELFGIGLTYTMNK